MKTYSLADLFLIVCSPLAAFFLGHSLGYISPPNVTIRSPLGACYYDPGSASVPAGQVITFQTPYTLGNKMYIAVEYIEIKK